MNKFKEMIQSRGVEYLVTYADNYAIGITALIECLIWYKVILKSKDFQKISK